MEKAITQWIEDYPLIENIISYKPVFWENPDIQKVDEISASLPFSIEDVIEASNRFKRFAPLIRTLFPETEGSGGIIDSELVEINKLKAKLEGIYEVSINGKLILKKDSHLPIAGSIKARGGIYEVLKFAENLAISKGLLTTDDDYSIIATEDFRRLFAKYTIAVGSTGNLGLSIGIIGTALGFNVTIHMSADAKEWKKELLRKRGANVVEYRSDYSSAVESGRKEADNDPNTYFVDDEQSRDLFLGYSVAALQLKEQLADKLTINPEKPLIVYLPCGVGGAPGGICFGLKMIFGDNVKCVFVEPTHSPAMLLGLITKLYDKIHVRDFNIDNVTEADGLAVGAPSSLVSSIMAKLLDAEYTIADNELLQLLALLYQAEEIKIEPSAAAGLLGPVYANKYLAHYKDANHLVWATGGLLLPGDIMENLIQAGHRLLEQN